MNLIDNLNYILETHRANDSQLPNLLNNGVPTSVSRKLLRKLKIKVPDDVLTLYSWRNGVNENAAAGSTISGVALFRLYSLLDLEAAIKDHKSIASLYGEERESRFFPIMETSLNSTLVIDCDDLNDDYGVIRLFDSEMDEYPIRYDSLTLMFKTIAECFKCGAYYWSDDGQMETNIQKEKSITKSLNRRIKDSH